MQQENDQNLTAQKIMKKLQSKEQILGGQMEAQSQEVRTTQLIQVIFETILKAKFDLNDVCILPEIVVDLYGLKLRADYIIYRSAADQRTPMLVIEVKRTLQNPNPMYRDNFYLSNHLKQLYRYLRHLAI